jgi:hypothetical protein
MSSDTPAPKTRKEKKKDQKTKGDGKNGKYSAKHARGLKMPSFMPALPEINTENKPKKNF